MQAADRDFYLTSARGGAYRQGAIFKMTASGVVTLLHSFAGGADGVTPFGPLVQATDGNLYGTMYYGGPSNFGPSDGGRSDFGTIFGMTVTGSVTFFRPLTNATALAYPKNPLLQAADGNFYGTTKWAAFMMSASGAVTKLSWFDPGNAAMYQDVPMIQAVDGSFYTACGIIFNEYPLPDTLRGCVLRRGMLATSANDGLLLAQPLTFLGGHRSASRSRRRCFRVAEL